jgi:hypothetical protein
MFEIVVGKSLCLTKENGKWENLFMKRNYGLARKIKVITAVLQKLLMRILQD